MRAAFAALDRVSVVLDGEPIEIVGILSRDFVHPEMVRGDPTHLYRPIDWDEPGLQEPGYDEAPYEDGYERPSRRARCTSSIRGISGKPPKAV